MSFATSCVCLERGSLCSAGIARRSSLLRTHPPPQRARPVPRGIPVGWSRTSHPMGLPVLPRSPYARMLPPIPRWNRWVYVSLTSPAIAAFPAETSGRLPHCPFSGPAQRFTARCSLRARGVTYVTLSIEGFSRFVTSTTAPIATGWSESCRVGLSPTE